MRAIAVISGLCLWLTIITAQAQPQGGVSYSRWALIDADNNPDTGCVFQLVSSEGTPGTIRGIEVAFASSTTADDLSAVALDHRVCNGGELHSTYEPLPPPMQEVPVGLDLGEGGLDVIEFGHANVPGLWESYGSNRWSLYFYVENEDADSGSRDHDVLGPITTFGTGIASYQSVPLISSWSIAALMLALFAAAVISARRRPDLMMVAASVATLATGGIAWAASHLIDGQIGDWAGVSGYDDAAGDATTGDPAIDIRRGLFAREGNGLYFRIDVTDVESSK